MFDRLIGWPRRRGRTAFWPLTLAAAVVAGLITLGVVGRAERTADDYGVRAVVAVAARDLDVGHEVVEDDVVWRELPAVLLPPDPLDVPVGRVVAAPVLAGEPFVARRLGPEGLRGPRALIGPGRRALVLARPDDADSLRVGDAVDLLSADVIGSGQATWVAREASVVALGETSATIAVDEADAPAAARAALDGTIAIALIGAR